MMVLVLGAGGSAGENVTRALKMAGHEVVGCDIDPWGLTLSSADHTVQLTTTVSTRTDRAARVAELNRVISRHGVDVIHAQPDPEVRFLSTWSDRIDAASLVPSLGVVEACQDKLTTALELGDLAPKSMPMDSSTVDRVVHILGLPLWVRARKGAGARAALRVDSLELADAWIEYWGPRAELMAAHVLGGRDLSWTGVYRDGVLLASVTKERLEPLGADRHPAMVSSTARVQQIVVHDEMAARSEAAVQTMDARPNGVFMVDARCDIQGVPRVTEINTRFGTTSLFFAHAGQNLVALAAEAAMGATSGPGRDCCTPGVTQVRNTDMGSAFISQEVPV